MPGLIGAKQMYIVIAMALKLWSLSDLDPSKSPLFFRYLEDLQFMGNSSELELLQEGEISSFGTEFSRVEIEALVAERFPRKAYCLVEDWLIFHVDESQESLAKVRASGLEPMFLYSHCVIFDGHGRFPPGGWVRSTLCKSFDGDCLFETRNTVYVLVGKGREMTASLKTIFGLC